MAEAEKDDWLDDFEGLDDKASGLDQSDLDTLLSGSGDQDKAAGKGDELELDQSAIDALMSGSDEPSQASSVPPAAVAEKSELEQSDIDSLLASPNNPVPDKAGIDPDQDEIDKLFSDVDSGSGAEESSFPAEEINFKDVFDSTDSAPPQSINLDFDAEEFKLDVDIPDIPDTHPAPGAPPFQAAAAPAPPVSEPTTKIPPEPAKAVANNDADPGPGIAAKGPGILRNRKLLAGLGTGIALLCAAGFYFIKERTHTAQDQQAPMEASVSPPPVEKPHEPAPAQHPPPPEPEPPKPLNAAPTVTGLELTMPPESSQLTISLSGSDPENDPLQYVMSLPEHGQLSGHPPNLTYTPNPDLNGQDGFIVRVSDGSNISAPALIRITRILPEIAKGTAVPVEGAVKSEGSATREEPATGKPVACPPEKVDQDKPEIIQAKTKSYSLSGSKGLVINWEKIWGDANFVPYKPEVQIDILAAPKHGTLTKINNRQSLYLPNPEFRGMDTIKYRFKLGKLGSQSKSVMVSVDRKDSAPVIHLQPIASSYLIGDTVILSAAGTSDDKRESLTFHWTQLAGAPIMIKPINSEGSQIAFVMPSTFSQVTLPTLTIKVTATDQEGHQDSKDITITAKSRRHSALWGRQ